VGKPGGQEEALLKAEEIGVSPVRIRPLSSYRHIFTHVEWEMTGYLILAEEMETEISAKDPVFRSGQPDRERTKGDGKKTENAFLTVRIRQMEEDYPIPSAYARYTAVLGDGRRI
jgi:A/G-specific adenine glycosylase